MKERHIGECRKHNLQNQELERHSGLKVYTALAEDLNWVPSTHIRRLTSMCHSGSWEPLPSSGL